ncbi:Uncharacterised protein [Chryseobacterium gleum]|uniref:Uncharacterized protein n=2 Tax=Chryseobacterium gleum TaxID=250 RepID=A0A3S4M3K3_CHRGE|nr:hypothetical protein [Chryseobacterium gleum]EFK36848.1 hypothetical protein HMPREF0204_11405 [Chryseobacterium gleum ATCC 35910]QQY32098.1 hypothetical protein I6I60_25255 [Chryseobacterium gleum]VEE10678.1 Uncharacterised protein [Chryseobacterium gleum]
MEPIDYSRGRNNANSKLAFQQVKETIPKMWEKVLNEVDGKRSTIEIATILRVPIHTISGRFSELKAKHKIYQTSSKKIGSKSYAVYSKTIN